MAAKDVIIHKDVKKLSRKLSTKRGNFEVQRL